MPWPPCTSWQLPTAEILSRYYYLPGIIDKVKSFVKNCYGCKKYKNFGDKYHEVLKFLPAPNKKRSHSFIYFIVDLPVNRDLWGKFRINIMVIINKLNEMVKCIFIDGITVKDGARVFYIHVWKTTNYLVL